MAVPGMHKVHCIQASGADKVKVANTSSEMDTGFRLCPICKNTVTAQNEDAQELSLTVGLWVVVKYDDEEFLGEITSIEGDDIEVNAMTRSARV